MNDVATERRRTARLPHRPKSVADETVLICLTLPVQQYDQIYAAAARDRVSIPEVIRRATSRAFPYKK